MPKGVKNDPQPGNVFTMSTPQKASERTVYKQACSQALILMMETARRSELVANHVGDVMRHKLPSHLLMMGQTFADTTKGPCSSTTFHTHVHHLPLKCSFCSSDEIESIGHLSFTDQFTARCVAHSTRKTTL